MLIWLIFWIIVVLGSVVGIWTFYRKRSFRQKLYFVRRPDKMFVYFKEEKDAMKFYKSRLKNGEDVTMKEVSLNVINLFGKEIQVEETISQRKLRNDKFLMGTMKKKKKVAGGTE